jgi:hypothetical protein
MIVPVSTVSTSGTVTSVEMVTGPGIAHVSPVKLLVLLEIAYIIGARS